MIAWKVVYGDWFLNTYEKNGEGFILAVPSISEVLFSLIMASSTGTPFLALGLLGFVLFLLKNRVTGALWSTSLSGDILCQCGLVVLPVGNCPSG